MIRRRARSLFVSLLAIVASSLVLAETPIQPAADESKSAWIDPNIDPGLIPNSAVATSDNCNKLAGLQEQFEHGFTAQDFQRIQGPEQHQPLGVSGKFRLAV